MYKYIYLWLYIFAHTSAFPVTSPRCHFKTGKSVWGNVACVRARMLKRSCSRKESSEFSKEKKFQSTSWLCIHIFVSMRAFFLLFAFSDLFFAVRTISQTQDIFLLSLSLTFSYWTPAKLYNWRLEGKAIHFFFQGSPHKWRVPLIN